MRGDEPDMASSSFLCFSVCPTCVGMNRLRSISESYPFSMPHMRGDEPIPLEEVIFPDPYAPHAWG